MPSSKTHWFCDICRKGYDTENEARACEDKGPAIEYPVGLIFMKNPDSHHGKDMCFAIAKNHPDGHNLNASLWACRDTGVGDSLGAHTCGSGGFTELGKYDGYADPDHPAFKRMVAYLYPLDIPITVWDGTKAMPLAEFLESKGLNNANAI